MCPRGKKLFTGTGGLLEKHKVVAHCLLIETDDGLVLVDTGFGTADVRGESGIPGPVKAMLAAELRIEETAIEQVKAMGRDPADVRHIIATHLDVDHAGGLTDFPAAKVHLHKPELDFAQSSDVRARLRYIKKQLAPGIDWKTHEVEGDTWFGFESVKPLPGLGDDIALVPLGGHSVGHSGVAVRTGDGWLLHAGDTFFYRGEIETPARSTPGWRTFQNVNGHDRKARLRNQERVQELQREHGQEVRIICSHDPEMFDRPSAVSDERRSSAPSTTRG